MPRFARKPDQGAPIANDAPTASHDEEYLLTPEEAQWARALALMTGFSHGCCDAHRAAMAQGIAEQLHQLALGAGVSGDMRNLLIGLLQRWRNSAQQLAAAQVMPLTPAAMPPPAAHRTSMGAGDTVTPDVSSPHVLWHPPLETLQ